MRRVMFVSLILLLVTCASAHDGTPCGEGGPMCESPKVALFCYEGNYRALPCPGDEGCRDTEYQGVRVIACDIRGTVAGDPCPGNYTGFVYCQSATSALRCNGTDFAAKTCPTQCITGKGGIGSAESLGTCN
jgi:hypothetical protein